MADGGGPFFHLQARTAVGMWKIGGPDVAAFPLPLPPLDIQMDLVAAVAAARANAAGLRDDATRAEVAARVDLERVIGRGAA